MDTLINLLLNPEETYTDSDKDLIRKNEDKLNDEEKEKFKEWLHPSKDPEEGGTNEDTTDIGDGGDGDTALSADDSGKGITKEQLTTILDDKKKEWDAAGVSQEDQDKAKKDIIEFWKTGEKPVDWNDAGTRIAAKTIEQIKADPIALAKLLAPHILKETQDLTNKQKEELQSKVKQIDSGFDKEMETLVKAGKIPGIKDIEHFKKDPVYVEANKQISALGLKFHLANMTDAYNLWKMVPQDQGGGLNVASIRMKGQKRAAGMIGSSAGGSSGSGRAPMSNKQLHETNIDKLIEQY